MNQTIKIQWKTFGTSVINSPLSQSLLVYLEGIFDDIILGVITKKGNGLRLVAVS